MIETEEHGRTAPLLSEGSSYSGDLREQHDSSDDGDYIDIGFDPTDKDDSNDGSESDDAEVSFTGWSCVFYTMISVLLNQYIYIT